MATVKLAEFPKGKEFEEEVAAYLQSDGKFVERNIVERTDDEILELDIVATQYNADLPELKLIEVKSGDWGFPDLFKVSGWMKYLDIDKGAFVVQRGKPKLEFYKSKAKQLGIDLSVVDDPLRTKLSLDQQITSETVHQVDIETWRFSYWLERQMLKDLNHRKKSNQDKLRYRALDEYFFELNSGIFFTGNIAERLDRLFSIYKRHPNISARCGGEMNGEDFDVSASKVPKNIWNKTFLDCRFTDIHLSTLIEHRARLAILKNAVDYNLFQKAGKHEKIEAFREGVKLSFTNSPWGESYIRPLVDLLPRNFRAGLDEISTHKYFHRYPVFWQWFLWAFGGFILLDYKDREYEALSIKTGIPVDEIDHAFSAYEILYPNPKGWFKEADGMSNIRLLKMFPLPFSGIGAHYRRMLYSSDGEIDSLELTGEHTTDDLKKWIHLATEIFTKEK